MLRNECLHAREKKHQSQTVLYVDFVLFRSIKMFVHKVLLIKPATHSALFVSNPSGLKHRVVVLFENVLFF